ncbi:hypothetical protein CY35_01G141600 [Sphagnum magellanicum]|nr:hypothetical protein CY35_01G141600 [Sphagnum magellanicum]KAH9576022.1 hypothetical protein CY35_01G141600 [Sphagnum magellanicum]KAH9576023.1 hypothetical protein CY35_01G141600 [Sphagnum magellanicum]KAH9576024.1 hypothetical protein CY35_01G141600 [Sphagnum magellanicum]KAH9576025.1 hypothetical protein CY35_01G141600 [Sphagnum magellanicum]
MEVQTCGKPLDALLERVLCTNILSSDYFKELYSLKTYTDVVDEIYNQVDHVEPWMTGNCRGPSTAFCLLYKLFTMKFSAKQMKALLDHGDSPYIRAIGFLYLRYVGEPKTLWGWFEQYVKDDEEFAPGSNGRMTTMGVYVRDLLLNQYYFDTLFPRIPVPILRQITAHLERMKLSTQPAGVTGTSGRHGGDDTARRPPSVKAALSVSFGQRAPHRAFTRDSSPIRRSVPVHEPQRNGTDDALRSRRPQDRVDIDQDSRERERERSREGDKDRDRVRTRDLVGAGRDRDRNREHDREWERLRERERERSRDRDREGRGRDDRERESSRDSRFRDGGNERARGRDKERERENDKGRERRDWSVERDRGRERERERERRYEGIDHHRSRSPGGRSGKSGQRSSQSPTKVNTASNNLKKLLDVYGDASDKKTHFCRGILGFYSSTGYVSWLAQATECW